MAVDKFRRIPPEDSLLKAPYFLGRKAFSGTLKLPQNSLENTARPLSDPPGQRPLAAAQEGRVKGVWKLLE